MSSGDIFPDIEFGGFSVSEKLRIQKAKFQISWNLGWLIHAIQAVTNATSVSTSQPYRVRYFDQLPSLELIFAQSWSRVQHRSKSQDTLNIFRRTRGYPSVLRKVWAVYCSSQSWRFDCSWRKNSSMDTIQLPLVWLYQGKSFLSRFPSQEFSIWFQTSTSLRSITLRSGCWQRFQENSTHENSTYENSTHENSTHVKFHPTIDWRVVYT